MTGGDWFTHVHEYWTKCQGKDNFLFVKFEEVKKVRKSNFEEDIAGKARNADTIE